MAIATINQYGGSANGESVTEFNDEEVHKSEEYYSVRLDEVTSPEKFARWWPNYRIPLAKYHPSLKITHRWSFGDNAR